MGKLWFDEQSGKRRTWKVDRESSVLSLPFGTTTQCIRDMNGMGFFFFKEVLYTLDRARDGEKE